MLLNVILATSILITILMVGVFLLKARQYSLLWKEGRRCWGTIVSKNIHPGVKGKPTDYYLTYIYAHEDGSEFKNQSLVSEDFFNQFEENGLIELIIARSKPWISAPAFLIDMQINTLK